MYISETSIDTTSKDTAKDIEKMRTFNSKFVMLC